MAFRPVSGDEVQWVTGSTGYDIALSAGLKRLQSFSRCKT